MWPDQSWAETTGIGVQKDDVDVCFLSWTFLNVDVVHPAVVGQENLEWNPNIYSLWLPDEPKRWRLGFCLRWSVPTSPMHTRFIHVSIQTWLSRAADVHHEGIRGTDEGFRGTRRRREKIKGQQKRKNTRKNKIREDEHSTDGLVAEESTSRTTWSLAGLEQNPSGSRLLSFQLLFGLNKEKQNLIGNTIYISALYQYLWLVQASVVSVNLERLVQEDQEVYWCVLYHQMAEKSSAGA